MNTINTTTINMKNRFYNADAAFTYFLNDIRCNGIEFGDTKALFNVGFTMEHPRDMFILTENVSGTESMLKLNGNGIYRATVIYIN